VTRVRRNCRVSVSLTEHEKQVLEKIAERSDLSLSRIVQEAVREFAKDQADKAVDVLRSSRQLASA
jgi:predicted transcriptional regulator